MARFVRLRGSGLRRRPGDYWVVWPDMRHWFQCRIVPRREADEFYRKLQVMKRGIRIREVRVRWGSQLLLWVGVQFCMCCVCGCMPGAGWHWHCGWRLCGAGGAI